MRDKGFMRGRGSALETVMMLTLFLLFALSSLLLTLFGANVYKGISSDGGGNYALGTSLSYVAGKVRGADAAGGISVGKFDGNDALLLTQDVDGTAYQTAIYYYDGALRELFAEAGAGFSARDGAAITALAGFGIAEEDGLLRLTATDNEGKSRELLLALRSR